jgi:hypothetical protein
MKRLLKRLLKPIFILLVFGGVATMSRGAVLQSEDPGTSAADDSVVTLTTNSYTAVPASAAKARFEVDLGNPGATTVVCKLGQQSVAAAPSWTLGDGWLLIPAGTSTSVRVDNKTKLWCYNLTSTGTVVVQETGPSERGGW